MVSTAANLRSSRSAQLPLQTQRALSPAQPMPTWKPTFGLLDTTPTALEREREPVAPWKPQGINQHQCSRAPFPHRWTGPRISHPPVGFPLPLCRRMGEGEPLEANPEAEQLPLARHNVTAFRTDAKRVLGLNLSVRSSTACQSNTTPPPRGPASGGGDAAKRTANHCMGPPGLAPLP